MGKTGSSSKRKSLKKSTLKGLRIKKSRRNKSKKLRQYDDSFSSCSDDESSSPSLFSYSSSESEYKKSKRSRSRARNEVMGSSKKRSRRRSLSEESSEDSPPVKKKRKHSKKKAVESRKKSKKIKKKKKTRRDAYSSDSESCSTCKEEDSSSDEGASHRRSRGKSGSRKYRSRSSSPSNSYDDENIEKMMAENTSRRLKSVITVAEPPENEEVEDMKKDELKEEIMYDHDDYPSSKSNDSNEIVDCSNVSPEKMSIPTSVIEEVNSASGIVVSEVEDLETILRRKALENLSKFRGGHQTKPAVPDINYKTDQSDVKQPISASVSMSPVSLPVNPRSRFTWRRDPSVTTGKEKKAATDSGPLSGGSQPAAPKLQSVDLSSTSEKKIVNEQTEVQAYTNSSIGGIGNNEVQKSTATRVVNKTVNEKLKAIPNTNNTIGGIGNNEVQKSTATRVENKTVNETLKVIASTNKSVGGIGTNEVKKSTATRVENKPVNEKPKVVASTDKRFGGIGTNEVQKSTAVRVENTSVVEKSNVTADTNNSVDGIGSNEVKKSTVTRVENKSVTDKSIVLPNTNDSADAIEVNEFIKSAYALEIPSSPSTKEGSSKEQLNESNDNSQFEKKTMTVMRGGEMVQVSYKVYIPTRAPALSRRKLKR